MSEDHWSEIAGIWSEVWGATAEPAWRAVLDASGVAPGARVLDVGCGGGEFLAYAQSLGLRTAGADPAPGMLALAAARVADLREAGAEDLPWPDASFDLVTAFNSLQFAEDTDDGLAELIRVTAPGGHVAIANWAERALNDLDAVEQALADGPAAPDGDLRVPGGLEELLEDGGLTVIVAGLAEVPWRVPDEASLVRGILLGEDHDLTPEVIGAARAYRHDGGGYLLVNHFRFAVGRRMA
ncbi:class I SAM-dependent methyltransferase [Winogradskya humida]|uniref:Methyltransferase type 11 domain-containing protein n=1 Tax=Winogradskya humida TaxID=113566 RepID=A0ABQ4A4E5_9ACTN|nr:class I SAM-dependent methyltransferase [Actinoplanes humidus]GIE25721.1 hypothetical protein Ahu01nite_088230 [Actinoplanes humidus]